MIDLGAQGLTRLGVSLLQDEAQPRRYLAVPPAPRVAVVDGAPQVLLLRFVRDGELTGGHLSVTTELAHPPELLAAVQQALIDEQDDPEITVGPLPVTGGQASLFFLTQEESGDGGGGPLVRRLFGETAPLLDAPHRARFSALLSADGVRVVEAALRSGGAPVGVAYHLQVEGLRPAQRVVARIDYHRVYEHLSSHAREGALLAVSDVFHMLERLQHDQAISISVVHALLPDAQGDAAAAGAGAAGAAGAGDAAAADSAPPSDTTDAALAWLQREVIERFCVPVLPLDRGPARVDLGDAGELLGVGSALLVRAHMQIESGTTEVDLQRAVVVVRTLTLQGHLRDLLAGSQADAHIADAGLDHPFFQRVALDVRLDRPPATLYVKEIIGDWAYGATRQALRLTAEQPEARAEAWADADADHTWELQLDVALADDAPIDAGAVVRLPALRGQSQALTLDLGRLLSWRRVDLSLSPDPRVLLCQVTLRHLRQGAVVSEQELRVAGTTTAWLRDHRAEDRIEAAPRYLLQGGRLVSGPSFPVESTVVRLPPAYPGAMTVTLYAEEDFADLQRVVVSLQKREDLPVGTFTLDRGGASIAVSLELPDPSDRGYRYRVARLFADGRAEEDDWAHSDSAALLVGSVAGSLLRVDLTPVGPELPAAGIVLIEVELSYIDAPNQVRDQRTLLIRARADRPRWEVALADPKARGYEYRVITHRTSGSKQTGPWTRTSERLLPIPIT